MLARGIARTQTVWEATKGLLGRSSIAPDAGLFIRNCRCIHMFFMRFAIDAVFLDESMRICKIDENLKPWRVAFCMDAVHVLEMAAGDAAEAGLQPGMRVSLVSEGKSYLPGQGVDKQ